MDLDYAAKHGIVVFNSPFSNSRSVAELVIAEVIGLARQLGDRSMELHNGIWNKVSNKCWEIRGKTLGRCAMLCCTMDCEKKKKKKKKNVIITDEQQGSLAMGISDLNSPSWQKPWECQSSTTMSSHLWLLGQPSKSPP